MGALARLGMPALAGAAIRAACARGETDPAGVEALLLGCQLTAGLGPNPAAAAAAAAGLAPHPACRTFVSGRASGLQAVVQAHFEAGVYGAIVAAGADSISGSPLLVPKGRAGSRLGGSPLWDPAAHDAAIAVPGDPDPALAAQSIERAQAQAAGDWIATVEIPDRRKGPQPVKTDVLPGAERGSTAPLADGAAAVLVQAGAGDGPRIVAGVPFGDGGGGPAGVAAALLEMTGWTGTDLTVVEVPEDVAGVATATAAAIGAPGDRVNRHGGALGRGVPPAAGGVIGLVHACELLTAAGSGRALVIAGSGPDDGAGLAIELA